MGVDKCCTQMELYGKNILVYLKWNTYICDMKKSDHIPYPFNPSFSELENYIKSHDKIYRNDNIKGFAIDRDGVLDIRNVYFGVDEAEKPSDVLGKEIKKVYTDSQEYYKVFKGSNDDGLTLTGYKLLKYISNQLKPRQNEVALFQRDVMDGCKWTSRANYYNAIIELLNKGFIYKKANYDSVYFINVCKLFNGERITALKEYLKLKESSKDKVDKYIALYNAAKTLGDNSKESEEIKP